MESRKPPLHIIVFNLLYISAAFILCQQKSNIEFFIYIGVVAAVMILMLYFYKHSPLSLGLLWFMSFWGLAHMAGGLIDAPQGLATAGHSRVLYNLWIIEGHFKYDQLVHAYGFGLCTWLLWDILRGSIAKRAGKNALSVVPTFGLLFLCALGGMGLGALNEVIEFMVMLNVPDTNVGGYENTGWDLFANMAGALFVALIIWTKNKFKIA